MTRDEQKCNVIERLTLAIARDEDCPWDMQASKSIANAVANELKPGDRLPGGLVVVQENPNHKSPASSGVCKT